MMSRARRRWLRKVGALAVLLPGGLSGLIREVLAKGPTPVQAGIQTLKGDVRVNGQPAREGMLVKRGDTVKTGPGAEVTFVIGGDAFIQRGDSLVEFGSETAKQFMRVVTGRILSVFAKEGPRTLIVSTATIGIRGTACYIEDLPAADPGPDGSGRKRTYFCLCYGDVEVVPNAAPEKKASYRTRYHDHPIYINDDPAMSSMMDDAKVINHTDTELILLEALVGRRPPFWGQAGGYT